VRDFGTDSSTPVDYPTFIRPVAEAVARGEHERGIVLGGSGNGEAIVANRLSGIRCAVGWNVESVRLGRAHNDSNVLSLGERFVAESDLMAMLDTWLPHALRRRAAPAPHRDDRRGQGRLAGESMVVIERVSRLPPEPRKC
jgi:RpiB/LacA/LacB family sugar-phosphate isomerase